MSLDTETMESQFMSDELDAIALPHPAAALLKSFVDNALDQSLATRYLRQRLADDGAQAFLDDWIQTIHAIRAGDAPPAPDPEIRRSIFRRDSSRCCITGKQGSSHDPLVVRPILHLPSLWLGEEINQDLLAAFLTVPYRNWWLSRLQDPDLVWPLSSHWAVRESAAEAFAAGCLKLDRLQPSAIEYEVHYTRLGPESPLGLNGSFPLLGDHSRSRLQTVDPRLVGTHARFAEGIRLVDLAQDIAPELLPTTALIVPRYLEKAPIECFPPTRTTLSPAWDLVYRSFFYVWRLFPSRMRIAAYEALRLMGFRCYGQSVSMVQRLPFGLYLKYQAGDAESQNEYHALQQVRRHTTIPVPQALDLVTMRSENAYLVMSRLPGIELSRCQSFLSDHELEQIAVQLTEHISSLRNIPHMTNTMPTTISNTLGEACRDPRVQGEQPVGPFQDEASFSQELRFSDDPRRRDHQVVFTHADLNPRNVLINPVRGSDGTLRWAITGIVDWTTAGYYPEYWEFTKSQFERFRWPRRYNEAVKKAWQKVGDYSEELDLEIQSWEMGDGV